MLLNYLTIAFRALLKNKVYTFINLFGLAAGLTVSILIMLFVSHEWNYDRFHTQHNRLYRMLGQVNYGGHDMQILSMSGAFGPALKEQLAGVEDFVRLRDPGRVIIESDDDHRFFENKFLFVDPSFLTVFSFPLTSGRAESLNDRWKVMLTEEAALRYFGHTQVIGKTITYNKTHVFEIAGIVRQAPSYSTIQFDFIASFVSLGEIEEEKQQFTNEHIQLGAYTTYLLLEQGYAAADVEAGIPAVATSLTDGRIELQALSTLHLGNTFADSSNTRNLYIFVSIAVLILALALVNYINLTTARASTRAKEVGIRKVSGARRFSLSAQFYTESALLTAFAFLLALALVQLFMPALLGVLEQRLDQEFLTSPKFISILLVLFGFCVLVSGSYPSVVLSRFQPAAVLKGIFSGGGHLGWVRKGFTGFQFIVSIGLIICTLVVNQQLTFLRNKASGFDREQLVVIKLSAESANIYQPLKNSLRQLTDVQHVSAASTPLYQGGHMMFFTKTPGTQEDVTINTIYVDEKFTETLGLTWQNRYGEKPLAGHIVINESAVARLKIEDNPVGQKLTLGNRASEIRGVVEDFNYQSLHSPIEGLAMVVVADTARSLARSGTSLYVKINGATPIREQLKLVQAAYDAFQTGIPFEYYFLDDAFNRLYKSEERLAQLFGWFSGIGVTLACLGLFGLVTFALERRVKEIGIRKVLGASVLQIMRLLSSEYVVLFVLSSLIAAPIAWYVMEQWLSKFPYRIDIAYWMIGAGALTTFLVAAVTLVFKVFPVSRINPAESLRNE